MKISINHLTLDPDTTLWDDETVERLFVEYDLLGEIEETPEAVDIPLMKDEKMVFNYKTGKQTISPCLVMQVAALPPIISCIFLD